MQSTSPASTSEPSKPADKPVGHGEYKVVPGDCIISIAADHGHFWETIWDHEENGELRELRKSPSVLMTGDLLHIPPLREKLDTVATEARHRYRRKGVPAQFTVRLLFGGKPRSDVSYTLIVGQTEKKGKTDRQGRITAPVQPGERSGLLTLHAKGGDERMRLVFGGIEPLECVLGVQQRLLQLGLLEKLSGRLDQETKVAITEFQVREGLEPRGLIDEKLISTLRRAHGS